MELPVAAKELAAELGPASEAVVGPMIGIATIALNMALKYCDINTVQDGVLYQQYKIEGKNLNALHLDMVFETAMQIEKHLVAANKRVSQMIVAQALAEEDFDADGVEPDTAASEPDEADSKT